MTILMLILGTFRSEDENDYEYAFSVLWLCSNMLNIHEILSDDLKAQSVLWKTLDTRYFMRLMTIYSSWIIMSISVQKNIEQETKIIMIVIAFQKQ